MANNPFLKSAKSTELLFEKSKVNQTGHFAPDASENKEADDEEDNVPQKANELVALK